MGYGLLVNTSNSILQLDSDQAWEYGQATTGTANSWTMDNDEVLFIKFPAGSSGTRTTWFRHVSSSTSTSQTVQIRKAGQTTAFNMDYALIRPATKTAADTSQTYGLQLYNSSQTLIVDSRRFGNSSFTPTNYFEENSLTGYGTLIGTAATNNSDSRITTDFNAYVSMNWSYYASGGVGSSELAGVVVANNYTDSNGTFNGIYALYQMVANSYTFYISIRSDILLGEEFS